MAITFKALLLLAAFTTFAATEEPEASVAASEEKPAETADAAASPKSDVVKLTAENFNSTLSENKVVFVKFYAPWCGHCQRMAPAWEETATELKAKAVEAVVADVDCTDEANSELAEEHGVRGFPTIKLYKNGKVFDYDGSRGKAEMMAHVETSLKAAYVNVSLPAPYSLLGLNEIVVAGMFEKTADVELFQELADSVKMTSSKTSPNFKFQLYKPRGESNFANVPGIHQLNLDGMLAAYGAKSAPAIAIFRAFDEPMVVYPGKDGGLGSLEDVKEWLMESSFPLVADLLRWRPYLRQVMTRQIPYAWLFVNTSVPAEVEEHVAYVTELAKKYAGKMQFLYVDGRLENIRVQRGVPGKYSPAFSIMNGPKVYPLQVDVTKESVTEHINAFMDGKVKALITQSEEAPKDNSGPVTLLTAKTFDSLVDITDKAVLIEFYAPWCGHCKALAPVWEELGKFVQDNAADKDKVSIAKFDVTANQLPEAYEVEGFPTMYLSLKGGRDSPVPYDVPGRELKDFVQFLVNKELLDASVMEKLPKEEEEKTATEAKEEL